MLHFLLLHSFSRIYDVTMFSSQCYFSSQVKHSDWKNNCVKTFEIVRIKKDEKCWIFCQIFFIRRCFWISKRYFLSVSWVIKKISGDFIPLFICDYWIKCWIKRKLSEKCEEFSNFWWRLNEKWRKIWWKFEKFLEYSGKIEK